FARDWSSDVSSSDRAARTAPRLPAATGVLSLESAAPSSRREVGPVAVLFEPRSHVGGGPQINQQPHDVAAHDAVDRDRRLIAGRSEERRVGKTERAR